MFIEEIESKKQKLEIAKNNLKGYFVGLDNIIDKIFNSIEIWYYMPDILERPIIINLWGMTGIGKTDLVRRLVKELSFESNYCEIQMKNSDITYGNSVQDMIDVSGITSNSPGIILFDEIQRYRSIDEEGKMLPRQQYDDIWMLLSDGKFSDAIKEKERLFYMLLELEYELHCEEKDENSNEINDPPAIDTSKKIEKNKFKNKQPETTTTTKKQKRSMSVYEARYLKRKLELRESLPEIMQWSIQEKIEVLKEKIRYTNNNENVKTYNQALIFICGNLDEVYKMADEVSETDIDADILYEHTKKINILSIKSSLLKRFSPEQIARFGNNHIIYPSLNKSHFTQLITKKLKDIHNRVQNKFDVQISFMPKVNTALYRNGVYPVQGTRPLFSTINNIIENLIPHIIYNCRLKNIKEAVVDINEEKSIILAYIGTDIIEKPIDLQLDKLIKNISSNETALVIAHEVGHLVAHCVLFESIPSQVVCNSASSMAKGFIINFETIFSKQIYLKLIQVDLAGTVAEELFFGNFLKTDGNSEDIIKATTLAANMIRRFNMGNRIGRISHLYTSDSLGAELDIEKTNKAIEKILIKQKKKTKQLLKKNRPLVEALIQQLIKTPRMSAAEIYEITKNFNPNIQIRKHNYMLIDDYMKRINSFLD